MCSVENPADRSKWTPAILAIACLVLSSVVGKAIVANAAGQDARNQPTANQPPAGNHKEVDLLREKFEIEQQRADKLAQQVEEQRKLLEHNQRVHTLVMDEILAVLRTVSTDDSRRHQLLVAGMAKLGDLDLRQRVAAFRTMGNALVTANHLDDALAIYQEGLNLDPHDASTFVSRGDVYFRRGEFQKAADDYTKTIENRPTNDPANKSELPYCRRAIAYCRLGNYAQAGGDLHRSYDALPQETRAFVGLRFSGAGGDMFTTRVAEPVREPLLALIDRWFDDQKRSDTARMARADFRALCGSYDLAIEDWDELEKSGGGSSAIDYRRAVRAVTQEDQDRYRQICAKTVAREAKNPSRLALWACIVGPTALDDYAALITAARGSLEKAPNDSDALMILGGLLFRAGEYKEARDKVNAAIQSRVNTNGAATHGPFFVAMAQYHLGQRDEARQTLQRASTQAKQVLSRGMSWLFISNTEDFEREARQLIRGTSSESTQ